MSHVHTTISTAAAARTAAFGGALLAPVAAMAATEALEPAALPVALLLGLFAAAALAYFASARALVAPRRQAGRCRRIAALAAALGGVLVAAPAAAAHDLELRFGLESVTARTSQGTVSGDVAGSLATHVRKHRLPGARWRVAGTWTVDAGERSFTARLRGVVNLRTRRAVMDGRVVSGFLTGAPVRERGRVVNRKTGRLAGTLTVAGHAARRTAATAPADEPTRAPAGGGTCADPCVFVLVVRYGDGRVTSGTGSFPGEIDCGTKCSGLLSAQMDTTAVLTATGASFVGWKDCPTASGARCFLPLDGGTYCVRAFFTADWGAPPAAGACPSAEPPAPLPSPPVARPAPETRIVAGPQGRTSARRAVFTFRSSDPDARFLCRLDARPWTRCTSPRVYRRLAPGRHVFRVAAVSRAGSRDTTPATRRWTVRAR